MGQLEEPCSVPLSCCRAAAAFAGHVLAPVAHLVGWEVHPLCAYTWFFLTMCMHAPARVTHTCSVCSLKRQTHRDSWLSIKCLGILTFDAFLGLECGQHSGEVVLLCPVTFWYIWQNSFFSMFPCSPQCLSFCALPRRSLFFPIRVVENCQS